MGPTLIDMAQHPTGKILIMNPFDWPVSFKQDIIIGYAERVIGIPIIIFCGQWGELSKFRTTAGNAYI